MSQQIRSAICTRLVLFLVFACTLNVRAHGQQLYFSTIELPGGYYTYPQGINASGQIVGTYENANFNFSGFLDTGGQFITLDFPGAFLTFASGINASGQIVGSYNILNNAWAYHGFLYSGGSGGQFTTIDFPGAFATFASGINASGQIVGYYCDSPYDMICHGFLYSGGQFTTIEPPGAAVSSAFSINASGQIVGAYSAYPTGLNSHGFLYSGGSGSGVSGGGGQFTTIDFPGAAYTSALSVNASGQIVGTYSASSNGVSSQGFLYSGGSGGQYTTFDRPGGGGIYTAFGINGLGINDEEQIVGTSGDFIGFQANPCPTGNSTHAATFHGVGRDGTATDPEWSGYAVTGSSFRLAKGSWKVPSVACSQTPKSYSAFWVGIDGYPSSNPTVEQTGTISSCNGSKAEYYAWYQFFPNLGYEFTDVPVKPGDVISASVTYDDLSRKFTATITNETTNKHDSSPPTKISGAQRSSAEWIAEAPCSLSGGLEPLSDFGIGYFGQHYTDVGSTNEAATDSSVLEPIAAFGSNVYKITMKDIFKNTRAEPSELTPDGTSFDVVWDREN